MPTILTISNLTVQFSSDKKTQPVLKDFSLTLNRGECVGLVGESGSGKTVSALAVLQLLPQAARISRESQILFRDQNLLDFSEKKMRRVRGKHIGMIFQDAMTAFNPVFTIGQQLMEVIRLHLFLNTKAAYLRALTLLEEVGISDVERCYHSYPHQLSGGMRQRAMIAMALAGEPEILIADEPTTALDVTIQSQVLNLLLSLKKERHCGLIFIGHDLSVVSQVSDQIIVLKQGEIIETAQANIFFQSPQQSYSKQLLDAILPIVPRKKPENNQALLTVSHLKQYFPIKKGIFKRTVGYVKAVDDVSFVVPQGETLAIVGESGSGKTTTAKAILQLIKNTDGKVLFLNQSLSDLKPTTLRKMRTHFQIIFQDPNAALNPRMMIIDSLLEGLLIQKKVKNKKEAINMIDDILRQVELPIEFKWRYPHEFSGGQRQRICIARALTLSPALLVLDEPTSALDVSTQKQILMLLDRLQSEKKLSYLLITHNLSVVAYLAHHVVVMQNGRVVEKGDVNTILCAPTHPYTQKLLASAAIDQK